MKKGPSTQGDLFGEGPPALPASNQVAEVPSPFVLDAPAVSPAPRTPVPPLAPSTEPTASRPLAAPPRLPLSSDPQPAWRAPAAVPQVLSVAELTRQIKGTLERGFARVIVRGEISGFRGANPRGHLYFSLKDADACIDAKIWATAAQRLKFGLRDGLSVIAEGTIDVYAPQGRYSLIVSKLEPEGEGALALAFAQLKERLLAEGLFGDRR